MTIVDNDNHDRYTNIIICKQSVGTYVYNKTSLSITQLLDNVPVKSVSIQSML